MFGSLDISTSGLVANRIRLEVVAANTANQSTLFNEQDQFDPYRARIPLLATGDPTTGSPEGVHVADIALRQGPLPTKYDPGSPYADKNGNVAYPNVNIVTEQINALEAQRAYEANITVIEATKSMISVALQMIA